MEEVYYKERETFLYTFALTSNLTNPGQRNKQEVLKADLKKKKSVFTIMRVL